MAKIFLSSTMYDRDFVERIDRTLKLRGHSVFVDRGDVAPGMSWADTIRSEIGKADLFVAVASEQQPNSDYALNVELGAAWGLGKPITAVVFPGVTIETALPLPHTGYQVVPVEGRSDEEIAAAILAKVSEPASSAA
jgi:hypothetical protein